MEDIINFPHLEYRKFSKEDDHVFLIYHKKVKRILLMDIPAAGMYDNIEIISLQLIQKGYTLDEQGKFQCYK